MTEKLHHQAVELKDIILERLKLKYTKKLMKMTPLDL
jgi:hypothetical protein